LYSFPTIPEVSKVVSGVLLSEFCAELYSRLRTGLSASDPPISRRTVVSGGDVSVYYSAGTGVPNSFCGRTTYRSASFSGPAGADVAKGHEVAYMSMRASAQEVASRLISERGLELLADDFSDASFASFLNVYTLVVVNFSRDLALVTVSGLPSNSGSDEIWSSRLAVMRELFVATALPTFSTDAKVGGAVSAALTEALRSAMDTIATNVSLAHQLHSAPR
jgi:hypothetical protein